jgi:hypothetical protein
VAHASRLLLLFASQFRLHPARPIPLQCLSALGLKPLIRTSPTAKTLMVVIGDHRSLAVLANRHRPISDCTAKYIDFFGKVKQIQQPRRYRSPTSRGQMAARGPGQGRRAVAVNEIYFCAGAPICDGRKRGGPGTGIFRSPTRVILTACNFLRPQAD